MIAFPLRNRFPPSTPVVRVAAELAREGFRISTNVRTAGMAVRVRK